MCDPRVGARAPRGRGPRRRCEPCGVPGPRPAPPDVTSDRSQDGVGAAADAGAGGAAAAAARAAALGALRRGARRAQVRGGRDGRLPGRRRARRRDARRCPRRARRRRRRRRGRPVGTGRAGPGGRAVAPPPRTRRPGRAGLPEPGAGRRRSPLLLPAPEPPGRPWGPPRRSCAVRFVAVGSPRAPPGGRVCAARPGGGCRSTRSPCPRTARAHAGSQGRASLQSLMLFSFVFRPSVSLTLAFLICFVSCVFVFPK